MTGRFSPQGATDLEKDADLALFLLSYLESRRDPASGSWPGDSETRRLQSTCHIAEALGELELGPASDHLVEPAVKWLTDMPLLREVQPQDRHAIRIYPARFKTLAALHRFDLRADFDDLCQHADPQTGWLLNVPGAKSSRATLIWLDALLQLGGDIQLNWRPLRDNGLNAVAAALNVWLAPESTHRGLAPDSINRGLAPDSINRGLAADSAEIDNVGDAAYALDLLLRAGRLTTLSPATDQMLSVLIQAMRWRDGDDALNKQALYGCLQLARHFSEDAPARAAVSAFVGEVRARYETGDHQHQPDHFHALALRLLAARHQTKLRDLLLEKFTLREQQTAASQPASAEPQPRAAPAQGDVIVVVEQENVEPQQSAAFVQLVQQHVKVKLGQVVRLSGTRARATVYRVHFSLHSDATDSEGHPLSALPDSFRLVIKQGSIESLARTIKRYGELPAGLLAYFAKHADRPESAGSSNEWYLVMEDLVGMSPLGEILDRLDDQAAHEEQIGRLAATVGEALSALHRHRRRAPLASNELGWLYLTPITEALNKVCEAGAFPELKPYVEKGFECNGWRYHDLNTYLAKLQWHAAALAPPAIGTVHGDCHSRNLMIDGALSRVKFVDLETLSYIDDYLTDYGLLLEDVALYRYLPRGQRPNCLSREEIVAAPGRIDYPYLPRQADSILRFQKDLIAQIESFAGPLGDAHFKPRLWLAIARNLILLASRQIPVQPLEGQSREDALKLVMVAYAEAIRLLDELIAHLNSPERAPLLDLPFTGQPNPRASLPFPLDTLQEAILQLDVSIVQRQPSAGPGVVQYLIEDKPFAEINASLDPPTLSLIGRPEQPAGANIVIPLLPATSLDDAIGLVRQAYFLALAD